MKEPSESTKLQPGQRMVAFLILRLGAIAYQPTHPRPGWTADLLAHATMMEVGSVMEVRACLLTVLLAIYCPSLEDGSQYRFMSLACESLQQMM